MTSKTLYNIGIDLGTTFTCAAVYQNGKVEVIVNDQGNRTTPSYILFDQNERAVGEAAKNRAESKVGYAVYGVKRMIGREFNDPMLQEDIKNWHFKVVNDRNKPKVKISLKDKDLFFAPEELSAMILAKMKKVAEMYLGAQVNSAVITVPAYFTDAQRQCTKHAGKIAGLKVARIINEPTAAALAYGLHKNIKGERKILVFDLGGGTFDVSILVIDDGQLFTVKSTSGDTHLGGEDFDQRIMQYAVDDFEMKYNCQLRSNAKALYRLRNACEQAKRTLSSVTETLIEVVSIQNGHDLSLKLTRAKFEDLCSDLFKKTLIPVKEALDEAHMTKNDIDDVILVGGSTRIPKIQKMLSEYFNHKEINRNINPDEAVAYGAAVQAAILAGNSDDTIKDILLLDVLPLSLGIETVGGIMNKIIKRNTKIPWSVEQRFTTYEENQNRVSIIVYEGERSLTKHNHRLGRFELGGILPAPKGVPCIIVKFDVDQDGILNVTATDEATGHLSSLTIKNDNRLNASEIQKMVEVAERYKEEDEKSERAINSKNTFEAYLNYVAASVKDYSSKFSDEDKKQLQSAVEEGRMWLKQNPNSTAEECDEEYNKVSQGVQSITRKLYEKQSDYYDEDDSAGDDNVEGPRIEEVL